MKKPIRAAGLLGATITTSRGADSRITASQQTPPAETEIRALRSASNQAIAFGDLAAISATLSDDFVVVIGDGTLLSRAEYLEAFANTFQQAMRLRYERIVDTIRLSSSLPLAAEHGHWIGSISGGQEGGHQTNQVLFTGTYMAMWRHDSSDWRLRSELFVSLA